MTRLIAVCGLVVPGAACGAVSVDQTTFWLGGRWRDYAASSLAILVVYTILLQQGVGGAPQLLWG
jgi:hypothetical protein